MLRPSSSGFSLVSVLVSLGLISIVTMTTLHLVRVMTSQSRYMANIEDLSNVSKQVSSILSVPANCVSLFGGEIVDISNRGTSATVQLDVSGKVPYAGADPMSSVSSGRIHLLKMGLLLKRSLAGAGTTWYQGDAVIQADDPNENSSFAARKVPVNFQFDSSGNVIACATAGLSITAGGGGSTTSTGLAYGQCGPGQVMIGITANGVICSGGAQTATGTGCTGNACNAIDGGPCYGDACKTNGSTCSGDACTACGTHASSIGITATCLGNACCAGPTCGGC